VLLLQAVDAQGLYPDDEVLRLAVHDIALFDVREVLVIQLLADFVHPAKWDVQVVSYLPGAHTVELVPVQRDLEVP